MSQDLVNLTIDGIAVQAPAGTLLVEAASQVGILIPVYCYHPKLAPVGACRMCMVEVEGSPKLIASCTTPVREGMVVHTANARVEKARRGMLEFLLIHHPLDCPVCDKGGECPLQDYTYEFGPSKSRFNYPKRHWEKPVQIGKNILLDRERCIMCFRCVRFCEEISGHRELGVYERGHSQEIGVAEGRPFDSVFSGNTIELCPVGALTGKPTRFFGRPWDTSHSPSVCTSCSLGCNVRVDHRLMNDVVRLWNRENPEVDDGWLCDIGRFGFEYVDHDRLLQPSVKKGEKLEAVGWTDAVKAASDKLGGAAKSGKLGVIASPRLSNEELWLAAQVARETLGCENIDSTAGAFHRDAVDLREAAVQAGFRPATVADIDEASHIVAIGLDLERDQPVTELRVKKALFKRNAILDIASYAETDLGQYARKSLVYEDGGEAAAIEEISGGFGEAPAKTIVILGWKLALSQQWPRVAEALAKLANAAGGAGCVTVLPHCNSRGALDFGLTPTNGGMSGRQILEAAADGGLECLWLLGDDPLADAPAELVDRALRGVARVVYQGWSVARLPVVPDIALPTLTFAEQSCTYTNSDGRVQRSFAAIRPSGQARPGWEVLGAISAELGKDLGLEKADTVFGAITRSVERYAHLKWSGIGTRGVSTLGAGASPAAQELART